MAFIMLIVGLIIVGVDAIAEWLSSIRYDSSKDKYILWCNNKSRYARNISAIFLYLIINI